MDRRQFLKKAGLARGLSAAGVVTFKRAYVKPVIQMLEPKYAEALTPVLSVTLSQLGGNSIKAGGGGIFTVGVWTIDVPLSAPIPADLEIRFGVDYFSVSDDGVVSGAGTGMPPGTETFEARILSRRAMANTLSSLRLEPLAHPESLTATGIPIS